MVEAMQGRGARPWAAGLLGLVYTLSLPLMAGAQTVPQTAVSLAASAAPAASSAAAAAAAAVAKVASSAGAGAEPHDEAAITRKHRLQHLVDRALISPEDLKAQCRYESEITTPPPARRIALTFDDGPEPGATEAILKVLAQHHAPATFFMIGEKVERYPELVAQVQAQGQDVVASHSWSHPNFHDITPTTQADELHRGQQALHQVTPAGDHSEKLFRYPYGNSTCESNELLRTEGYKIVGWHIDSCDWAFDRNGAVDAREALECGVLPQNRRNYVAHVLAAARAHNGGIVLMHEIHPHTVEQLDTVLSELEKAGFTFGSIEEADFQGALR